MFCNQVREEFGNRRDAALRYPLRKMPRVVQEIDVFSERVRNLVLGHDAPIDPPRFPVTPLDLQLFECPSIRQVTGVLDGAGVLERAALIPQRNIKVRRQHSGLLGLRVSRVLDVETIRDGECIIYG